MQKLKISARSIVDDIRSGMTDLELEQKYGLSSDALQYILRRLCEADVITQLELYERTTLSDSDMHRAFEEHDHVFKCPICGKTIPAHADECTNCEVINQQVDNQVIIESLEIVSEIVDETQVDEPFTSIRSISVDDLLVYCNKGSLQDVENMLEKGIDVNGADADGTTPLMVAAREGRTELVKLLLERGADPDARDGEGITALTKALERGHQEIVKLLLNKKENGNSGSPDTGGSYRIGTVEIDAPVVTNLLREPSAESTRLFEFVSGDLTIKANSRSIALLKAASKGKLDAVELLLKAGVDVNTRSKYGNTPLMRAAFKGHLKITALLLKMGADINAENAHGNTALLGAVIAGQIDMVDFLIKKGASLNSANIDSNCALLIAADLGNKSIAKILLMSGANVNQKNSVGDTPLLKAANKGNVGMCKLLLRWKADPNAGNKYGNTALMKTSFISEFELSRILLESGADVNQKNIFGNTALMKAAYRGHARVVNLLIHHGADLNLTDNKGKSAVDWAAAGKSWDVHRFLKQHSNHSEQHRPGETEL
ncbi:ankyrin repeat domain-containing protein [Desulfomonile tiedjei]|uniref:Ankyrin repeat-containing protein n=1 Tax=Desulfomonile tiedjei (strain ATCC 49306 / DSM 6799 / DCB-1) TaxID=706587 RepID=I4CD26_DESTA|nr:ankyrin repeat domain-containing protein [Desulfomonile tiedjei]AFM27467.1 ankyrin repeat-containing protein [Desulfomonile tiedjei DSM 6799]